MKEDEILPYPLVPNGSGIESEEYVIPEKDKKEVLQRMYPFDGVPDIDSELFDLHEGRLFIVKDFKVVRERGKNYLVSPYYYNSGGSVIDWMPASWANPDELEDAEEEN